MNPESLKAAQPERLKALEGPNLTTANAYRLKLTLQDFCHMADLAVAERFLADWCVSAHKSGLQPVAKVARTLAR